MLTEYIFGKLNQAKYKILDDGSYFGEIKGMSGVWASGKTLEHCREELREVLEEWLILKIQDGDKIPSFSVKTKPQIDLAAISRYA